MPAKIHCRRSVASAVLAYALFIVSSSENHGIAATESNRTLMETAAELQGITGGPVEIHVTPPLSEVQALAFVNKTVIEAFRDAVKDPETKDRLNRIVRVVVLEGWMAGAETQHVKLKDEVLTVQTLMDRGNIEDLRPLIVQVLKKVAQLDAKKVAELDAKRVK